MIVVWTHDGHTLMRLTKNGQNAEIIAENGNISSVDHVTRIREWDLKISVGLETVGKYCCFVHITYVDEIRKSQKGDASPPCTNINGQDFPDGALKIEIPDANHSLTRDSEYHVSSVPPPTLTVVVSYYEIYPACDIGLIKLDYTHELDSFEPNPVQIATAKAKDALQMHGKYSLQLRHYLPSHCPDIHLVAKLDNCSLEQPKFKSKRHFSIICGESTTEGTTPMVRATSHGAGDSLTKKSAASHGEDDLTGAGVVSVACGAVCTTIIVCALVAFVALILIIKAIRNKTSMTNRRSYEYHSHHCRLHNMDDGGYADDMVDVLAVPGDRSFTKRLSDRMIGMFRKRPDPNDEDARILDRAREDEIMQLKDDEMAYQVENEEREREVEESRRRKLEEKARLDKQREEGDDEEEIRAERERQEKLRKLREQNELLRVEGERLERLQEMLRREVEERTRALEESHRPDSGVEDKGDNIEHEADIGYHDGEISRGDEWFESTGQYYDAGGAIKKQQPAGGGGEEEEDESHAQIAKFDERLKKEQEEAVIQELAAAMETDDVERIEDAIEDYLNNIPEIDGNLTHAKQKLEQLVEREKAMEKAAEEERLRKEKEEAEKAALVQALADAVATDDIGKIQTAIEAYEKKEIPEINGNLTSAKEKVAELLKKQAEMLKIEENRLLMEKEVAERAAIVKKLADAVATDNIEKIQAAIEAYEKKEIPEINGNLTSAKEKLADLLEKLAEMLRTDEEKRLKKEKEEAERAAVIQELAAAMATDDTERIEDAIEDYLRHDIPEIDGNLTHAREKVETNKLIQALADAVSSKEIGSIQTAIEQYMSKDIPEINGNLSQAMEKVETLLELTPALLSATVNRQRSELEKYIALAEEKHCENNLGTIYTNARRIRDQMELLESLKGRLHALDNESVLAEMRSYNTPPEAIHVLLTAVYTLLGEDEAELRDWASVKSLLARSEHESLRLRAMDFEVETLDLAVAHRADDILRPYSRDKMARNSAITILFYDWCMGMIDVCETLHSHGFHPDPATSPSPSRRRRSNIDSRKPSIEGRKSTLDSKRPSVEGKRSSREDRRKSPKGSRKQSMESSSSSSSRKVSLEQRLSLDGKKLSVKQDNLRTVSAEDRLAVQARRDAERTSSYYLEGPLDEDDDVGPSVTGSSAKGSSVDHPRSSNEDPT